MSNQFQRFQNELRALENSSRKRFLTPGDGCDFTSNDFLALNSAAPIRQAVIAALNDGTPVGSGGSRLLRGNHLAHIELEKIAAEWFGSEKSLYFANGYTANFALLTALPKRQDLIVFDALSHASIREGLLASSAKSVKFAHNDMNALETVLTRWCETRSKDAMIWIVAESLYSMDGDFAPLAQLMTIAARFDAMVLIDEAHATGVWGERGRGLTEPYERDSRLLVVHTCGKALGVAGALVCAPAVLIDYLVNKSRPFIYSTAPPPVNAVAVKAALELLSNEPWRRQRLRELITFANQTFEREFGIQGSGSQIIPYIVGEDQRALEAARAMQVSGFDVRAIRPPTVPDNTARLRISITLNVDEEDISNFFAALRNVMDSL